MSKWVTGTLVVLLIGTGYYGYSEYQSKNEMQILLENQYQRSFHNLSSHVDLLQDQLGKSLAVNSYQNSSVSLADAWRVAYSAQSDLAQLPLMGLSLSKTQDFLHNTGQKAYELSLHPKPSSDKSLTESEWNSLHDLYKQSKSIEGELRNMQLQIMNQKLSFRTAENDLQSEKRVDNQILDGFKTLEKQISQYSEVNQESTEGLKTRNEYNVDSISGKEYSINEVKDSVAKFLGWKTTTGIRVVHNGPGARFPSYSVTAEMQNQPPTYLGVSQKGGHIVWMSQDRVASVEKLDLEAAQIQAEKWVQSHGYMDMKVIDTNQVGHFAIYQFTCQKGKVTYYPCSLSVKVSLADGAITGFTGQDYVLHHKTHLMETSKLSESEARKHLNSHLTIQDSKLAQIDNVKGKLVTVWEFLGTLDDNTYRIFINAENGMEERVEKLQKAGMDASDDIH